MRISDWSSDVCSSDLCRISHAGVCVAARSQVGEEQRCHTGLGRLPTGLEGGEVLDDAGLVLVQRGLDQRDVDAEAQVGSERREIGRAWCRERGCEYG